MTLYLVVGGLAFLVVLALGAGVFIFANPRRTAQDRLQDLTGAGAHEQAANPERLSVVSKAVATGAAPKAESEEHNALRSRLIQSGIRGKNNV